MPLSIAARSLPSTKTLPDGARRPNEDAFLHATFGGAELLVIADGNDLAAIYGRPRAASHVSRLACETVQATYHPPPPEEDPCDALAAAVSRAITAVCDHISGESLCQYQSTTLTALVLSEGIFVCAHVGDGALYLYRHATETIARVTPSPAPDAPVFIEPAACDRLQVAQAQDTLAPGDHLLLTTDGLINLWEGDLETLFREVARQREDPATGIVSLFARAQAAKRHDDLTCFLVRVDPVAGIASNPPDPSR